MMNYQFAVILLIINNGLSFAAEQNTGCGAGTTDANCCSVAGREKCNEGEGDCDLDSECADGLVCGTDNCGDPFPGDFDCCRKAGCGAGTTEANCCSVAGRDKCNEGEGDCDLDSECADGLVCGTDNCGHPFPGDFDCCRKAGCGAGTAEANCCSVVGRDKCNEGEGDCDLDSDCADGLVCGTDNCGDTHPSGFDCCQQVPGTINVEACEHSGSDVRIQCDQGMEIKIKTAFYGAEPGQTCPIPNIPSQPCKSDRSLAEVKARCEGKNSCSVPPSNGVFGDPCPGTGKFLKVGYECGGKGETIVGLLRCAKHSANPCLLGWSRAYITINFGAMSTQTQVAMASRESGEIATQNAKFQLLPPRLPGFLA